MRLPPINVLLTFPAPNYVDPVTRSTALIATNSIFITLVLTSVSLRIYSRIKIKKWFGWDDSMIILAAVFAVALCVIVILANRVFDWDRHIWDVRPSKIQGANIMAFTAKLVFTFASTFTRVSLCCFYYRLIQDSGIAWFKWVVHATMAYLWALFFTFIFLVVFLCSPVQSYWVFPIIPGSKCIDEGTIVLTSGILTCFSDFLVATLPIPIVSKLKLPRRNKIAVCILLSLGYVVTIAGIVRTYFIYEGLVATWDETWYAYYLWIAAAVEVDLAIICACAPAIHGLLRAAFPGVGSRLFSRVSSLRGRFTPSASKASRNSRVSLAQLSPFHNRSRNRDSHANPKMHNVEVAELAGDELPLRTMKSNEPVVNMQEMVSEERQSTLGARDDRMDDDEIFDEPSRPPLKITKTQTFEQETSYSPHPDEASSPRAVKGWLLDGSVGQK